MSPRKYQYVGPKDIRDIALSQPPGIPIRSVDDLATWLARNPTEQNPDSNWVATFTVSEDETLCLAPRRSEHVACAAGGPVLSAGEITIDAEYSVVEISNQSTGFCPEPHSWSVVESVLNQLGINHPGQFTNAVVFRLCLKCNQRNIVKDSWYYCELCDAKLSETWNFAPAENTG